MTKVIAKDICAKVLRQFSVFDKIKGQSVCKIDIIAMIEEISRFRNLDKKHILFHLDAAIFDFENGKNPVAEINLAKKMLDAESPPINKEGE